MWSDRSRRSTRGRTVLTGTLALPEDGAPLLPGIHRVVAVIEPDPAGDVRRTLDLPIPLPLTAGERVLFPLHLDLGRFPKDRDTLEITAVVLGGKTPLPLGSQSIAVSKD